MRKLLLSLFVVSTVVITGCNRAETNPEGRANIIVTAEDGTPVQNALVLFKSPNSVQNGLEVYKYTEIDGSAFVRWNYHVYADVSVVKGGFRSCGAVEIRPGETTTKTIVLLPTSSPANGCPQ